MGGVLNKDGKCLNCQEELGHRCTKCNYTLDKENSENYHEIRTKLVSIKKEILSLKHKIEYN